MADLKAIETLFDGHRFRSRLEARWAVFFKAVGLTYEYEAEGYELGRGVRYLPDFYLPQMELHAEVKPNLDLSDLEIEKLVRFSCDGEKRLLLIVGTPCSEQLFLLDRSCLRAWSDFQEDMRFIKESGGPANLHQLFCDDIDPWALVDFGVVPKGQQCTLLYKTPPPRFANLFESARQEARQARFEHGRSGN